MSLGLTAPLRCAIAVRCYACIVNYVQRERGEKMYYELFMCAFLIIGIICAILLALAGEFILSFLCVLMSFVCICGLLFL